MYAARITSYSLTFQHPTSNMFIPVVIHMNRSCISPSRVLDDASVWTSILEAIDGRLRPAPAFPIMIINTLRPRYLVPSHGNAANAHANNPKKPLFQLPQPPPTHMHHRHIDHALTSRTRLWRTPVPNSSHPYADVIVGAVVPRLLDNQNITSSHHLQLSQSHIPLSHCVRRRTPSQHHTSHVTHIHPSRTWILLSHAFGTPWASGLGNTPRRATSTRYTGSTEA
jgi:hypothetical protein